MIKRVKMEPKRSTVSCATVALRDVTAKQRIDSNHLAHRAWAERNGKWSGRTHVPILLVMSRSWVRGTRIW